MKGDFWFKVGFWVALILLMFGAIYARYKFACKSNWDCMYADKIIYIQPDSHEERHRINGEL